MIDAPSPAFRLPHSRDDPPWSHLGDPADPHWGQLFAWPAAGRAVMLSYDSRGLRHAVTLFDPRGLGPEIVVHGRRFDVRRTSLPAHQIR